MEQVAAADIDSVFAKESWTFEDQRELLARLYEQSDAQRKFRTMVGELEAANPQPKGSGALKVGIARYMLCRYSDALAALAEATDNKDRRYFQAMCYKSLRQYDKALEELERAKDRGFDAPAIDLQVAEIKALSGDLDGARKLQPRLEKSASQGDQLYIAGLIEELAGNGAKAAANYTKAREVAPAHYAATFRLAYYLDLHGEEDQAIELYKVCLSHPPVYTSALLNLAVLNEDAGRVEQAMYYLRRVLMANPAHARARLFYKDVEASRTMYYDEDQAKRVAKRNAVLDIPVTDFELSVRARNCLKKMSVRTLGDLVRTSESDLLAYKNFGETSLKEIKDMLTAKGLRLGQASEEPVDLFASVAAALPEPKPAQEGAASTPIAQVEFSIRARKAIESLGVQTIGDLAGHTEAELLACKNFGQTSLNEVNQRLAEYGLQLKEG